METPPLAGKTAERPGRQQVRDRMVEPYHSQYNQAFWPDHSSESFLRHSGDGAPSINWSFA